MVSQEQINEWREQHGTVLHLPFSNGRNAYLKQPDKRTLGLAYSRGAKDPLGISDVLLANCWLGGDEDVKTDVGCLIAVQELANEIAGKVDCTVVRSDQRVVVEFVDGHVVVLKEPNREQTSAAMLASRKDPLQMVESILHSCAVKGVQEIEKSTGHLISLIQVVDEIIGVKTVQVKKI